VSCTNSLTNIFISNFENEKAIKWGILTASLSEKLENPAFTASVYLNLHVTQERSQR
jgi:hypothetical protein